MNLLVTIIIIVIGLLISVGNNTPRKRLFFVVMAALLVIGQITFRDISYVLGNDTNGYYNAFKEAQSLSLGEIISNLVKQNKEYSDRDPGYNLLVKTFQLISSNFTLFLFLTAIIIIIPISKLIYRYCNNIMGIALSYVVLEFFFEGFFETGIRQTIALGIVLSGYPLLLNNKIWKYVIIVIIASTIHATALIVLPIIATKYIRNIKPLLVLSILITPVLMVSADSIVAMIGKGSIYESYLIDSSDNFGTPVYSSFVIILTLVFFYLYNEFKKEVSDYKILSVTMIGSLVLMPLSWIDSNLLRLSFYYSLFYVPLIPIIFKLISSKFQVSYNFICFCAMAFLVVMMSLR